MATCSVENCIEPPNDFVRIALTATPGSITVEVLMCELHITSMELANNGQYIFIRKRIKEDGFLH